MTKMITITIATVLLLAGLVKVAPANTKLATPPKTYTDTEYQFSFSYPADWQMEKAFDSSSPLPFVIQRRLIVRPDAHSESEIRVDVWRNREMLPLEDWFERYEKRFHAPKSTVLHAPDIQISGLPGILLYEPSTRTSHGRITALVKAPSHAIIRIDYYTNDDGVYQQVLLDIIRSLHIAGTDITNTQLPASPLLDRLDNSSATLQVQTCCEYTDPNINTYPCSNGNCTWWAKYKRPDIGNWWGNAHMWRDRARQEHFTVGYTAQVGAVVVFQQGAQGADWTYGHVAYVESVGGDGTFTVSEMAWGGWIGESSCVKNSKTTYRETGDESVTFIYSSGSQPNPNPTPVPTAPSPPTESLTIISASPQGASYSPGQAFHPDVVVQTNGFTLDCSKDFLENRDGNLYTTWPIQGCEAIGNNRYRIYFNTPMQAPDGNGTYRSRWQIWQWPNHLSPEVELWFDVGGGYNPGPAPSPNNRAPDKPTLKSPGDWAAPKAEQAPELCWNSVSDPDGDSVQYYAEIFESSTGDNSGWISGTCWQPSKLTGKYHGYQWHVKARDSNGKESGWSDTWHFNMVPPNNPTPVPETPTIIPTIQPGPVSAWWNANYQYRAQINVTAHGDQPAGRIINMDNLDTDALVASGKLRQDRNDLRIVRRLPDDSWQEIARNTYTAWNIEFQLPEATAGSGSTYYVYYGNPNADAPPTFAAPAQGWTMKYFSDTYWESYVTTALFNRSIDTDDICNPERDGGFEHRDRTGGCFDDSDSFNGRVFVPYTGDWTFKVYTADGYKVVIHGEEIAYRDYNSGTVHPEWISARTIFLRAGWHEMDLRASWVNSGKWKFGMEGPNYGFQVIPAENYQREFGNTRWGISTLAEETQSPPTPTPTEAPTHTPQPLPTATSTPFPTMTPTSTPTEGPTPVPQPIPPILKVRPGASTMSLSWSPSNDPDVTEYQVLRTLAENEQPVPVTIIKAPSFLDVGASGQAATVRLSSAQRGDGGCYQVQALRSDGSVAATSNLACDTFGTMVLWVPDVWAKPGEKVLVPVNIHNASGLTIAASEIRLAYDSTSGLVATRVLSSSMIADQYELANDLSTPDLVRVSIYPTYPTDYQPESPYDTTYDLQRPLYGTGTLFWVEFQVNGQEGNESRLEVQNLNGDMSVSAPSGTVIYALDDLSAPAPLTTINGRLRMASSYNPGDMDGTGTVQGTDASLALQSATGQHIPAWQQLHAGDMNGDGRVGAADAAMMFYRYIQGMWFFEHETTTQTQSYQRAPDVTTTFSISPTLTSVVQGNSVTVTLEGENLQDVAAAEFTLTYDPLVVQDIISPEYVGQEAHDNDKGQCYLALASNQPSNGNGELATIVLHIAPDAPAGTSTLAIANAQIFDLTGRDSAASARQQQIERFNGVVDVTEANPTPTQTIIPTITVTPTPIVQQTNQVYLPLVRR